jgi:hypothetical protein
MIWTCDLAFARLKQFRNWCRPNLLQRIGLAALGE